MLEHSCPQRGSSGDLTAESKTRRHFSNQHTASFIMANTYLLFIQVDVGLVVLNTLFIASNAKQPNIVFIVADDQGWNDVGFHNPDIHSPNIDKLAREGMILNQSYTPPACSPTRSAILTGRYPFKLGTQHSVILNTQPACFPLKYPLLSDELKKLGYKTHIVGKWHGGFCKWECTPTYRGFDSFLGFYSSALSFYNHTEEIERPDSKPGILGSVQYLDFRDNTDVGYNYRGVYSTFAFSDRAVKIITDHNPNLPLFLYLPYNAPHWPLEAPKEYEAKYPNIHNKGRRTFSAMVSALDDGIGRVVAALKAKGIYDNTLIVFTADNGGELLFQGSSYPLKGGKRTLFEGGTRVISFIHGKGVQKPGTVSNAMFHAVDWLPTLVTVAGGRPPRGLDGINQWKALSDGRTLGRSEFVYNIDDEANPVFGRAAIRVGKYKLIDGYPGPFVGWYPPNNDTVDTPLQAIPYQANATQPVYLFDLNADPEERNNLAQLKPEIVDQLRRRLNVYRQHYVPAIFPEEDPDSNPELYGGVWSPGWC